MTLDLVALALAAIAMGRRAPGPRALGLLAALVMGVAAASLELFADLDALDLLRRGSFGVDAGGQLFLNITTGLVLLSLVLAVAARPGVLAIIVAAAGVWVAAPLWRVPGISRAVGTAAATVAVASISWWLVIRLKPGRLLLAADRILLDRGALAAWRPGVEDRPSPSALAAVAFTGAAIVVPHLWTVLGGAGLALVAAWVATRHGGRPGLVLLPAALLVFLALLWSVRLAGPLGGWIPDLVDGPFSPRAAILLAAICAGAVVLAAGAWPLHGLGVPMLLAPLALPVAGTFATLLVPDGVRFWQPLLAPLTLLGMMHALAARRADAILLAGGLLGFWTATSAGAIGGALLVASAWVMAIAPGSWFGRLPSAPAVAALAGLVPAAGALLVLHGHLATEVTYGLLAVGVAAVAIASAGGFLPGSRPID